MEFQEEKLSVSACDSSHGWVNAALFGLSGSDIQVTGSAKEGSKEIIVDNKGDFLPGGEVTVLGCHIHYYGTVYNEQSPAHAKNQSPLCDELEFRGLDPDTFWQTFIIHFYKPDAFHWMTVSPSYHKVRYPLPIPHQVWSWQGEDIPIGDAWFSLTNGVEIRFRKKKWIPGQTIAFHARNRLLAKIIAIRGNTFILDTPATNSASNVVVRHHAQEGLQQALDYAIAEKKGLFIPAGRYRLHSGLWIRNASVRVEGIHREQTLLDISEDNTAVFWISGGTDIVIRNLGMQGHTGFREMPSNTYFRTATGFPFWPTANQQMEVKGCSAVNFVSPEYIVFEDLKVTRMASEVFYSHGADRYGSPPYIQAPHEGCSGIREQYTKSCVYHRCRVSDCGFNAFNNNDYAENTSILHCHVERVTNFCENASKFTRIIGNYVKAANATSSHGNKPTEPNKVCPTQVLVADNVFEGGAFSERLQLNNHATQVIITNNQFIGYSAGSAIVLLGGRRFIITGNHIDLTRIDDNPDNRRTGIAIEASNALISNNHIYCRGGSYEHITGIYIAEDATNIHCHDNLVEYCGIGLRTGRESYIGDREQGRFEFQHTELVIKEFLGLRSVRVQGLPKRCDDFTAYAGWKLYGLEGSFTGRSIKVASYDAATEILTLTEDIDVAVGDRFAISPPSSNWQVHHNTFVDCGRGICNEALDKAGQVFSDNITFPLDDEDHNNKDSHAL
ncbi:MAG: hypothetical protein WDA18_09360 [Candidatus Ratteibacteria bacterium]|jgi:hypothetical protein